MTNLPKCPKCNSNLTYEDGEAYICPECFHEWTQSLEQETEVNSQEVRDAYGNLLVDGDSVTLIKDLKLKGSSNILKVGTKVKNIKIVDGDHNIDCRIDMVGALQLKSEFVKKII